MARSKVRPLDPRFVSILIGLERTTDKLLNEFSKNMADIVDSNSRGDTITDTDKLDKELRKEIAAFMALYAGALLLTNQRTVDVRAAQAKPVVRNLLRANLTREAERFNQEIAVYRAQTARRLNFRKAMGNTTLPARLKTLQDGTTKTVRNIVTVGIENGKGAKVIAKDIRQYIAPKESLAPVRPFTVFRERFGRPKTYVPKGVPSGSTRYNALRIARTETAYTYTSANMDFYKDKKWVKDWDWVLSNSHKVKDICDDRAEGSPYTWEEISVIDSHPNCVLGDTEVVSPDATKVIRSDYAGPVVELVLSSGRRISVTRNHVILTSRGWVAAKRLQEGDQVVHCPALDGTLAPNDDHRPASVADVFGTALVSSGVPSNVVPTSSEYLHGDAVFGKDDIYIVGSDCHLRDRLDIAKSEHLRKTFLQGRNPKEFGLPGFGDLATMFKGLSLAADGRLSIADYTSALSNGHARVSEIDRLGSPSDYHARFDQSLGNGSPRRSKGLTEDVDRFPTLISTDEIRQVNRKTFHGYVYDISADSKIYLANGIISSNCLCDKVPNVMTVDELTALEKGAATEAV